MNNKGDNEVNMNAELQKVGELIIKNYEEQIILYKEQLDSYKKIINAHIKIKQNLALVNNNNLEIILACIGLGKIDEAYQKIKEGIEYNSNEIKRYKNELIDEEGL